MIEHMNVTKIDWENLDYKLFIDQQLNWPSVSDQTMISIGSMNPAYAINAYHRLMRVGIPLGYNTPLAKALLSQAVGEEVIYLQDIPDPEIEPSWLPTLEECYDILKALHKWDDDHPITRSRALLELLTAAKKGASIQ